MLRNVEVVEDGHRAAVELDDFLLRRLDFVDVVADFGVHRLVVDDDLRKVTVQRVADDGVRPIHLAHQLRGRRIFANSLHGLAPAVELRAHVVFDLRIACLHRSRTDDDPEILGQNG